MTPTTNETQQFQNNFTNSVSVVADHIDVRINNSPRRHSSAWRIIQKVASIALPILSVIFLPISTILGFTAGAIFHKQVQSFSNKINRWFNQTSPIKKGLAIAGVICSSILLPPLFGLTIGSITGSKFGNYSNDRTQRPNR